MSDTQRLNAEKGSITLIYILYAIGLFVPLIFIAGIIVCYVKKGDLQIAQMQSHLRWQIRTFWFSLLWAVLGFITIALFYLGVLILFINTIWVVYRIARGWLRLNDDLSMYT